MLLNIRCVFVHSSLFLLYSTIHDMCLPPLLLLPSLAQAIPASSVISQETTQVWTVTRLNYHYMTEWPGFGPPHAEWPEDRKFKSELSFDVQIPDAKAPNGSYKFTCEAQWEHSVLPESGLMCDEEQDTGQDIGFFVAPCQCASALQ